jgi:Uma2 family endonuclease
MVWVIDPERRLARVYRPDGTVGLVRQRESLDGADVLPGLSVPLTQLLDQVHLRAEILRR